MIGPISRAYIIITMSSHIIYYDYINSSHKFSEGNCKISFSIQIPQLLFFLKKFLRLSLSLLTFLFYQFVLPILFYQLMREGCENIQLWLYNYLFLLLILSILIHVFWSSVTGYVNNHNCYFFLMKGLLLFYYYGMSLFIFSNNLYFEVYFTYSWNHFCLLIPFLPICFQLIWVLKFRVFLADNLQLVLLFKKKNPYLQSLPFIGVLVH